MTKSADLSITKTDGVASVIAGYVDHLHDHRHEQRTVGRPGRRGRLRPDPRGDVRFGVRTRLRHRGRHLHVHDVGCRSASGGFVIYQLTLAVAASYAPANLTNTASITSTPATDPNAANDSATDTDSVTTSADLVIVKTDSADPVTPGQAFTYTITVTNNGPSDSATVQVSDTVPAAVHRDERDLRQRAACSHVGNVVTCTQPSSPRRRRCSSPFRDRQPRGGRPAPTRTPRRSAQRRPTRCPATTPAHRTRRSSRRPTSRSSRPTPPTP